MKAMIFAAGLGSRLKPITDTRPKALVTVGGKTMLEHIILKLKAAGFDEIVINVHHFSNQILAFLEANQNFGVNIQISDETDCLLDTGGGLEKAYHLLYHPENMFTQKGETPYELIFENLNKGMDEEEIIEKTLGVMRKECYLLHNVDILSNCDFESLMYYHQHSPNINATLLVSQRKTSRYLLFNDDNLLCGWVNKDTMETKPAEAGRTQLIATTANLYFTLCMLDEQYAIANETASAWREAVDAIRAMKDAGMATEAAVAQNEAAYYSVETSVKQLAQSISETENSLCSLLAQTPHKIERGSLESQRMPADLLIGVPVQLLSRRPDVRSAEYSLMSAYYATAEARSALYPQITLSGTAGWTNSAGSQIVNPGKLLLSAAGQLLQPIFQAGANRARVKIAKAQQQEAMLAYEQTILNAGQEVNDALTACQTARESATLYDQQVASLRRAVESTELLMQHGSTTYLEVLTARQSLLSAQLQQVANRFTELQSVVTLYHALGGGRETETAQ